MNGSATSLPLLATAVVVGLMGGTAARWLSRHHQARQPPVASHAVISAEIDSSRGDPAPAELAFPGLTPMTSAAALDSIFHSRSVDRLNRLALFLPQADAASVETLARHFCDPKTEADGNLCIRLVLARWAELDPQASVAFCRTMPPETNGFGPFGPFDNARDTLVANAFEAWGRIDYAAALAAADTPRNRVRSIVGLSSTDPSRAFVELESRGSFFRGQPYLPWYELIVRLGAIDPARTAALSPVFGESAYGIASAVVPTWARRDPAAAAAWLASQRGLGGMNHGVDYFLKGAEANGSPLEALPDTLPPGLFRFTLRAALVEAEARRDFASTFARTMAMPKGFERQVALTSVAQAAMDRDDWATIMKIGQELNWRPRTASELRSREPADTGGVSYGEPSNGSHDPSEPFAKALRAHLANGGDPADAWAVARTGAEGIISSGEVLSAWLKRDPAAAVKAAFDDPVDPTKYTATLASAWFSLDPTAAQHFCEQLPEDSPQRERFLSTLASKHADADPAAALRWAGTLPESDRELARKEIVSEWAADQPAEAAQALLAHPELARDSKVVSTLIQNVAETDPTLAIPLFSLLPQDGAEESSSAAYSHFTRTYAASDERAASDWVAALPTSGARDQAISGMVEHLFQDTSDYCSAFAWADTAADEDMRQKLSNLVFRKWRAVDPVSARAALEEASLPFATINRLLDTP